MAWTVIYILVMVALILGLRLAAWQGLNLITRLFCKSVTALRQVQPGTPVSEFGSSLSLNELARYAQKACSWYSAGSLILVVQPR